MEFHYAKAAMATLVFRLPTLCPYVRPKVKKEAEPAVPSCEVCYESIEKEFELARNLECGHTVCSVCLQDHLEFKINAKKVKELTCPACPEPIVQTTYLPILSEKCRNKLETFQLQIAFATDAPDETTVFCPNCQAPATFPKTA